MKLKILPFVCSAVMLVGLSFVGIEKSSAAQINDSIDEIVIPVNFTETQKTQLMDLGFSEDEISSMPEDEYNKYKELHGEVVSEENSIYQFDSDKSGNVIEVKKVTFREYLNTRKMHEVVPFVEYMDSKSSSWMNLTTTAAKLSSGKVLLKNSFTWLSTPQIALTDVVGLTHSANAVKVGGTENFSYQYKDGTGTHKLGPKEYKPAPEGIAASFNLKAIGLNDAPHDHTGYISVEVQKGNKNDTTANVFGHYNHITIGLTVGITIQTGDITVSGSLKESKTKNTMVQFWY